MFEVGEETYIICKVAEIVLFKKNKELRAGRAVFAMALIQSNPKETQSNLA